MHAILVVIVCEFIQLPREVDHVPEQYVIEILASNRAHQPLHERMGNWGVRNRLDFLDLDDPQIGEPTVEAKQRVVVGADVFR